MITITKRGTHLVPLAQINNDIPSPGECVMEAQASEEARKNNTTQPSWICPEEAARQSQLMLSQSIALAWHQGWEFAGISPEIEAQAKKFHQTAIERTD